MRAILAEVGVDFRQGPPTPEQRDQIRKLAIARGLIQPEPAPGEIVITPRTVYRLPGGNKAATPEPVTARIGITDGSVSEVVDGLAEGDMIVTGLQAGGGPASSSAPSANPFGGGPRRF